MVTSILLLHMRTMYSDRAKRKHVFILPSTSKFFSWNTSVVLLVEKHLIVQITAGLKYTKLSRVWLHVS